MENVKVWIMFLSLNNINLDFLIWAWAWNMWPWGIQLMLCYKKRTIYIWHIFQTIRNTVRISIRKNVLMALKIEVQTLTINFCSWVDPLWICMKTKYPKSRKIQNRITLFEFMSLFHWNIVILNNVLFIILVHILIMFHEPLAFPWLALFSLWQFFSSSFLLSYICQCFSETNLPMFLEMFFH